MFAFYKTDILATLYKAADSANLQILRSLTKEDNKGSDEKRTSKRDD